MVGCWGLWIFLNINNSSYILVIFLLHNIVIVNLMKLNVKLLSFWESSCGSILFCFSMYINYVLVTFLLCIVRIVNLTRLSYAEFLERFLWIHWLQYLHMFSSASFTCPFMPLLLAHSVPCLLVLEGEDCPSMICTCMTGCITYSTNLLERISEAREVVRVKVNRCIDIE